MIHFFISSTFKDMHAEREKLQRVVLPAVRKYARNKGVAVDIVDLRWGIETDLHKMEQDSLAKIMDICLNEVTRCKYIFVMIGSYYGTIPSKAEQSYIKKHFENNRKKLPCKTDISLTQWELELAFLSNDAFDKTALCMFKKSWCSYGLGNMIRTKMLKYRIGNYKKHNPKLCICDSYYEKNLESFSTKSIALMEGVINNIINQEGADWFIRERRYADAYSDEKSECFTGRDSLIKHLHVNIVKDNDLKVIEINGRSGIGKSTLISKLYRMVENQNKVLILCGAGKNNSDYYKVLIQIILALENHSKFTADEYEKIGSVEKAEFRLAEILHKENITSRFLVFIDALDKISLYESNNLVRIFANANNQNVKLVCTQIQKSKLNSSLILQQELTDLSETDIKDVLKRKIYSDYEILQGEWVDYIERKYCSKSPLYLGIVADILKIHNSSRCSDRTTEFKKIIETLPDDMEKICWKAIQEAIDYLNNDKGLQINRESLLCAAGLIAISEYGLRETDLESILKNKYGWKSIDFAGLRNYLDHFFRQQNDGMWVYEHDIIRAGVKKWCTIKKGIDNIKTTDLEDMLYDYIKNDCDADLLINEGIPLSINKNDFQLGKKIMTEIGDSFGDRVLMLNAANVLQNRVVFNEKGRKWFERLIENDKFTVTKALASMLRLEDSEDYERRIPAKNLTQLFWKTENLLTKEAIDKYGSQLSDKEAKYAFASLCVEYVNICESTGESWDGFIYVLFPFKFFSNNDNVNEFDDSQKREAYKHLNSLLYCNNRIINSAKNISEVIIRNYKKLYSSLSENLINARYESNIGQYYNSISQYDKALELHYLNLYDKAKLLIESLKKDGVDTSNANTVFSKQLRFRCITIAEMLEEVLDNHKKCWIDIYSEIEKNTRTVSKESSDAWRIVGVAYRNIGMDIFKMDETWNRYSELINFGCKSLDISVYMLDWEKSKVELPLREYISSEIRKIGIYAKCSHLKEEQVKDLIEAAKRLCNLYSNKDNHIENQEVVNLNNNLKNLLCHSEMLDEDKNSIRNIIDNLTVAGSKR